ncbi:Pentatricopeptide repeat-containing protein [Hibiscus syriacus]|uniref:Pentatricopeptide repeat-containing protein n=1 Tax=Hibiscus syriacus TaxID=106335 RepID=A0A6A3APG5_HIBSY|nr:transcription factor ORG2-like [Hibiscus syriacus]KAE8705713.1 Pentatricopeptide repeat-containing protein [Hibiscus syriacus]
MCALAPFPTPNWPLFNPIGHELNYIYQDPDTIGSFPRFSPQSPCFTPASFDPFTAKKLNHNACERERRKKVNGLYSSLRSLLPVAKRMKKLSFPATVSYAVKYIQELQEELERLVQKKEELLLRITQLGGTKCFSDEGEERSSRNGRFLSGVAVSVNRLSDSEAAVQMSINRDEVEKTQLSEILHLLEQRGFLLLGASSFSSFGGMIFYIIHLQVEPGTTYQLTESDIEAVRKKVLTLIV